MGISGQRRNDILCTLGNVLAITPYSVITKRDHNKLEFFGTCYAVLVFVVIIIGNGLAVFGRFREVYPTFPSGTLMVTDLAVVLSTTVTNIFAILVPSVFRLEDFKLFFETFTKNNACIPEDQSVTTRKCKSLNVELAAGHVVLLVIFIFDAYVWITQASFTIFRHYIFRDFQFYHLFITSMTMYNYALTMKYRFEVINATLRKLDIAETCIDSNNPKTIHVKMDSFQSHQVVREISQMYETEMKQIRLFNDIFGWQILFMTLSTMMGLLNCWDIITVYIFTGQKQKAGATYGYQLIILSSLWALGQLIVGAVVVISCSKAERTAQEAADVCFNQLLKLPLISENPQERALRDELNLLSQLVIHRCPSFSAAGFFNVDCSLLLAIFGSVTSYVIVLIQFQ